MSNKKLYIFFGLIFILGFLPHLQILPLDVTVSGRWFYISALGVLGLLGTFLKDKYNYLLIVLIVVYAAITFDRSFDFRNGFSLYYNDIQKDPNNFNLHNNLGVEYFRMKAFDKAGYHFQKSVDLNPYWWTNYNNLGVYYENKDNISEAKKMYQKSIDKGEYYLAYENYLRILIVEKKYEEAYEYAKKIIKYFPQNNFIIESLQYLEGEVWD
jgi:tetratricopeptide (TPR) repeat protein